MQFEASRAFSRGDIRAQELLRVGDCRDFMVVEELFVHYGEKFVFKEAKNTHSLKREEWITEESKFIAN